MKSQTRGIPMAESTGRDRAGADGELGLGLSPSKTQERMREVKGVRVVKRTSSLTREKGDKWTSVKVTPKEEEGERKVEYGKMMEGMS